MLIGDEEELRLALKEVQLWTGIKLDRDDVKRYLQGTWVGSGADHRLRGSFTALHPLVQMMLACVGHLDQGDVRKFFNIYHCARAVPWLQVLHRALSVLRSGAVAGLGRRITQLQSASNFNQLEAATFELLVAARYLQSGFGSIEFIDDLTGKSPEFLAARQGATTAVECKKFDLLSQVAVESRELIHDLVADELGALVLAKHRVLVSMAINAPIDELDRATVVNAVREAATGGGGVVERGRFRVRRDLVGDYEERSGFLFPSPKLYQDKYGFFPGCAWNGLVSRMSARPYGPSWFIDCNAEAALRWRVTDERFLWKKNKLNFGRLFGGVDQLQGWGDERALHVWVDRDPFIGSKTEVFARFMDALVEKPDKNVNWVVFTEVWMGLNYSGAYEVEDMPFATSVAPEVRPPPVSSVLGWK